MQIRQSHRGLRADLRADLSAGLREAREDRERLRADINPWMGRMEDRMNLIDVRIDGIQGAIQEQGERLSRVGDMLHLHPASILLERFTAGSEPAQLPPAAF